MTRAIFARRSHEIANQIVDGLNCVSPTVSHLADRSALCNPTFLAYNLADALEFMRHALVSFDHRIKCVCNLSRHADPVLRKSRRKIAALKSHQCGKEFTGVEITSVVCGRTGVRVFLIRGVFFIGSYRQNGPLLTIAKSRRDIGTIIFQRRRVIGQLIAPGRIFFNKPAVNGFSRAKSLRTARFRFQRHEKQSAHSNGGTEDVGR